MRPCCTSAHIVLFLVSLQVAHTNAQDPKRPIAGKVETTLEGKGFQVELGVPKFENKPSSSRTSPNEEHDPAFVGKWRFTAPRKGCPEEIDLHPDGSVTPQLKTSNPYAIENKPTRWKSDGGKILIDMGYVMEVRSKSDVSVSHFVEEYQVQFHFVPRPGGFIMDANVYTEKQRFLKYFLSFSGGNTYTNPKQLDIEPERSSEAKLKEPITLTRVEMPDEIENDIATTEEPAVAPQRNEEASERFNEKVAEYIEDFIEKNPGASDIDLAIKLDKIRNDARKLYKKEKDPVLVAAQHYFFGRAFSPVAQRLPGQVSEALPPIWEAVQDGFKPIPWFLQPGPRTDGKYDYRQDIEDWGTAGFQNRPPRGNDKKPVAFEQDYRPPGFR